MEKKGMNSEEIALYDRQIRLWGFNAQHALRQSRVLLITASPLSNEIAKNLVLAGIGELCLQDTRSVEKQDVFDQFFVEQSDIGKSKISCLIEKLKELNPLVKLSSLDTPVAELSESTVSSFQMVIATQLQYEEFCKVNSLCRSCQRPFYASSCYGLYGFAFADLVHHEFVIEKTVENKKVEQALSATQKPIQEALDIPLGSKLKPRLAKKVPAAYPAILSILKYNKSDPESIKKVCHEQQLDSNAIVNEGFLSNFSDNSSFQWMPVISIIGGVVAQDALNSISKRQYPIDNLWIYDAETSAGPIYML
ncbi:SUMO E1-like activator enzyme Rad31 [Schizosaccharomyces cryophilus OY26]|uniref:SUMO E1-like activator enzyme Rad31 n=1 Tax=Schizosaccharomyces cryophilus (strain OY26 / ATCC MYA-4695 / CBS 11777 / NBRC 106824 / NRRL Y48691) TaxID=653667 RepID=S9XAU7_SCHCR|nr:SUMO E1-like activator enzyme Rad31 [Schizosaccharomyces cryophilus OY26]EPY50856.1 SUMO E1-like activator enzyme Rad31 [Schizosaccharomyces cryophilus OY26]